MKLEKLNDNQIRCTLNRADLAERELKISELAYGTEKAKDLFREMMQQASYEFGFEAEDIPLMIEAIPVSPDCIILVITKVEDPEELDTRFSKFAPSQDDSTDTQDDSDSDEDDITSLFSKIQEIRDSLELSEDDIEKVEAIPDDLDSNDDFVPFKDSLKKPAESKTDAPSAEIEPEILRKIIRIFSFSSFDKVENACIAIGSCSDNIESSLYKDSVNSIYYLVMTLSGNNTEEYNRICNSISEFGSRVKTTYATESYYKEHYETLIAKKVVSVLGNL